jgi:hypothetical protein
MNMVIAFKYRPRSWRGHWLHYACVKDVHARGQFHDPLVVPAADLEGKQCMMCKQPMTEENRC